jgi:predicted RNA binding protein YcfA (HicA-like mRNA interferase family)
VTRLPVVGFRTMNAVLLRLGFEVVRQKGSHVFYRHADGRTRQCPTIPEETWLVHCSEKFFERSS